MRVGFSIKIIDKLHSKTLINLQLIDAKLVIEYKNLNTNLNN